MDFNEKGWIKIEDRTDNMGFREPAILGHAVALGKVERIEDLADHEVDITPRQLDYDDTVAAINGLTQAITIGMSGELQTEIVHSAGGKNATGLGVLVARALHYQREIALRVPQPADDAVTPGA